MNKEETTYNQTPEPKGGIGALWGTLIVMFLLLFGAIYMFNQKIGVDNQATVITNTSDDLESIEADSKIIDIKNIDVEINSL